MSGVKALATIRDRLVIDPTGKIRVVFESDEVRGQLEARFECVTCADLLQWTGLRQLECPSCGYEVRPAEADLVLKASDRMIEQLTIDTARMGGKSVKWAWVMWLRRLLRPAVA